MPFPDVRLDCFHCSGLLHDACVDRFSALSGGASGADGYDRPRSSLGSRGMTPSRDGKGHYGQMPSRGKSGARSSRDQERESALAAARYVVFLSTFCTVPHAFVTSSKGLSNMNNI